MSRRVAPAKHVRKRPGDGPTVPAERQIAALDGDGVILLGNRTRMLRLTIAVVALAAFIPYLPTVLSSDFVSLDDGQYVTSNELVLHPSLPGIVRVFSEVKKPSTVAGYYQPLTMLSLMADSLLSGREPSAQIFHLTNVLLHALNAVLVMLIVRACCGGFVIPAAAAILWAVHPIQVESVAWISQRKTVLATCFALLAIRAYLLYGVRMQAKWLWLTVLAYVLACLAKPTVLFLPLVLMLLDAWPLRRRGAWPWVEKWPMWIIMSGCAYVAIVSQSSVANMGIPALSKLGGMALLCSFNSLRYLQHIVWPTNLCLAYAAPADLSFGNPGMLVALLIGVAAVVAWVTSWRWSRPLFVGVAAAAIPLSLAVGPVAFMQSLIGDRFVYFPLAMLVLPAAAGATRLWRRGRTGVGRNRVLVVVAALAAMAGLTRITLGQQEAWVDSSHLWESVAEHMPDSAFALEGIAMVRLDEAKAYLSSGDTEEANKKLAEALAAVNRTIELENGVGGHYELRAKIFLQMKRPEEALADIRVARQMATGPFADETVVTYGRVLLANGMAAEAIKAFDDLIGSKRLPLILRLEMCDALARAHQTDAAMRIIDAAVRENPDDIALQQTLATTAVAAGKWEVAAEAYKRARALLARHGSEAAAIDVGYGKVLLELGKADEASAMFQKASVRDQYPAMSALGLAGVAALKGDVGQAFAGLKQAIELDPEQARVAMSKKYFAALHGDARWREMVEQAASQPAAAPEAVP